VGNVVVTDNTGPQRSESTAGVAYSAAMARWLPALPPRPAALRERGRRHLRNALEPTSDARVLSHQRVSVDARVAV
jgi:hypothetical protein